MVVTMGQQYNVGEKPTVILSVHLHFDEGSLHVIDVKDLKFTT